MRDSILIGARSLVMLAFLVLVPAVAVVGTDWLPLKEWFGNSSDHHRSEVAAGSRSSAPAAPPAHLEPRRTLLEPDSNPAAISTFGAPRDLRGSLPPTAVPPAMTTTPTPSSPFLPDQSPPAPATQPVPVNPGSSDTSDPEHRPIRTGARGVPGRRMTQTRPAETQPVVPARFDGTVTAFSASTATELARSDQNVVPAAFDKHGSESRSNGTLSEHVPTTWMADAEQRLRQLGATYYTLEACGERNELYQFRCAVAAKNPGEPTHKFEATDSNPARGQARGRTDRGLASWQPTLSVDPKTVGDCPDFASAAEHNGTAPLSETAFGLTLSHIRVVANNKCGQSGDCPPS
jgi:hypothetical protein